jgi:hypothetical protein
MSQNRRRFRVPGISLGGERDARWAFFSTSALHAPSSHCCREKACLPCQCSKARSPPARRAVIREHFSQAPPLHPPRHPDSPEKLPADTCATSKFPQEVAVPLRYLFTAPPNLITIDEGSAIFALSAPFVPRHSLARSFLLICNRFLRSRLAARALRRHRRRLLLCFCSGRLSESILLPLPAAPNLQSWLPLLLMSRISNASTAFWHSKVSLRKKKTAVNSDSCPSFWTPTQPVISRRRGRHQRGS